MKRLKIGLALFVCGFATSCTKFADEPATVSGSTQSADCLHTNDSFKCVKYVRNYDGDTLTVNIPNVHPLIGQKIGVRVLGIDTPEVKGRLPCEKEAARAARGLAESLLKNAKRIDLEKVGKDKYFRILADVKVDGRSLSEVLIKNRLAYAYDGGRKEKRNWCEYQSQEKRK